MAEFPVLLAVRDAPARDDPPEVAERKALAAVEGWCDLLRQRGERVTFAGLLTARRDEDGAA